MFHPLLAVGLGLDAEGATAMVVKGLAVGGGFLLGYFLGAAVAWALDRWAFAHKAPPQLKKAVALVAGVCVAVLLAMILFGEGGKGLFGNSGGEGDKKGAPNPADKQKAAPEPPKPEPKKKDEPPAPKAPPKPTPGDLHITILGAREVMADPQTNKGRFYLLPGESEPKTFPEFQKAIEARRKAEGPPLKTVYYRFKNKSEELPLKHEGIEEPYKWLTGLGIGFVPE
jgi:hypothetical protein